MVSGGRVNSDELGSEMKNAGTSSMRWCPPYPSTVKLNTDTAYETESGVIAAGFVGRDHCGVVLLFACKGLPVTHDVEEAEARAALVGLQSLAAIHTGQVILEMDNQIIVKEVDKKSPARSHCYGIIMNIEVAMDTFAACTTVHILEVPSLSEEGSFVVKRNSLKQKHEKSGGCCP
ncbi:hypothetical protein ZWY2020_023479 [Hordeum vulgare]|nr:hypothetical protein ZWY2020_023478 [Hordeum vulgare]KAI4982987.1 hypothetical protein ZWY2020_023479 [Hordeum vulgare]